MPGSLQAPASPPPPYNHCRITGPCTFSGPFGSFWRRFGRGFSVGKCSVIKNPDVVRDVFFLDEIVSRVQMINISVGRFHILHLLSRVDPAQQLISAARAPQTMALPTFPGLVVDLAMPIA